MAEVTSVLILNIDKEDIETGWTSTAIGDIVAWVPRTKLQGQWKIVLDIKGKFNELVVIKVYQRVFIT